MLTEVEFRGEGKYRKFAYVMELWITYVKGYLARHITRNGRWPETAHTFSGNSYGTLRKKKTHASSSDLVPPITSIQSVVNTSSF